MLKQLLYLIPLSPSLGPPELTSQCSEFHLPMLAVLLALLHEVYVLRLGLHATVSDDVIQEATKNVLAHKSLRDEMSETSRAQIDGLGLRRIVHAIEGLMEGL